MEKIDFNSAMITGGAGFIGSYIAEKLVDEGISTKVIDNLVTGKMDNLVNCLEKENFSFLNHDLERFGEIKDGFCDVDVLFHFAADPSDA